ncbi:hypothetical protein NKH71_31105 [Mesorhizobium sp. M0983]|uniref:hypothetical protein n=1 Tax=Mesorhizobium sp. M0983 TaxID=2957040 RepID=UPI00333C0D74
MVEPDYPEMNESIDNISLYAAGGYSFAVETPQEGRTQNAHDAETRMLRAKKLLTWVSRCLFRSASRFDAS